MTLGATPVVRKALLTGEIDLYIEYTGNAGFFFNRASDPVWKDLEAWLPTGRTARLRRQPHRLADAGAGQQLLGTRRAPRRRTQASARDHERLRALGARGRRGRAGLFGRVRERRHAAIARAHLRLSPRAAPEDRARRRRDGSDDRRGRGAHQRRNTAMVYGTDGGIVAADLVLLEDDKRDQPVYAPVPIVRDAVLQAHPGIAGIVRPLMQSFTRDSLQALNARVQIDGESRRGRGCGLPAHQGLLALAIRARAKPGRRTNCDASIGLGVVLSVMGGAALAFLPFVVFKANRIVPGEPRALLDVLPLPTVLGFHAALMPGCRDRAVRYEPALAFMRRARWRRRRRGRRRCGCRCADTAGQSRGARRAWRRLLGAAIALGLLATDALTRLRLGPLLRVACLVAFPRRSHLRRSRPASSTISRSCASTLSTRPALHAKPAAHRVRARVADGRRSRSAAARDFLSPASRGCGPQFSARSISYRRSRRSPCSAS